MDNIQDVSLQDNVASKFIKVSRMHYTQAGKKKVWDIAETHNSVAVLIYHTTNKEFLLVKQFRPAVYLKHKRVLEQECDQVQKNLVIEKTTSGTVQHADNQQQQQQNSGNGAMTYELCAGICDKVQLTPVQIAKEEIFEGMAVNCICVKLMLVVCIYLYLKFCIILQNVATMLMKRTLNL